MEKKNQPHNKNDLRRHKVDESPQRQAMGFLNSNSQTEDSLQRFKLRSSQQKVPHKSGGSFQKLLRTASSFSLNRNTQNKVQVKQRIADVSAAQRKLVMPGKRSVCDARAADWHSSSSSSGTNFDVSAFRAHLAKQDNSLVHNWPTGSSSDDNVRSICEKLL